MHTLKEQLSNLDNKEVNKPQFQHKDNSKSIKSILGIPDIPNYTFPFGKYRGETLKTVYETDKSYLGWLYDQDFLKDPLKKHLATVLKKKSTSF